MAAITAPTSCSSGTEPARPRRALPSSVAAGLLRRLRCEQGQVLVLFVIFLPVAVLMASLVIDVANSFAHKRHLQTQADAAALAAATEWGLQGCDDEALIARAREYGGFSYNPQIGGTSSDQIHLLVNSRFYANQPSKIDSTVDTRPPCEAGMIDVKLTETNLPWYFKLANVPFINARARVSLFQADTMSGSIPVGVPDARPRKARVTFVDEETDQVLGERDLQRNGSSGGYAVWDNTSAPLPVTIDRKRIGVRVALGERGSLTCGDTLVTCYDAGSKNGALFVRGWSGETSVAAADDPRARDVQLFNGTCTGLYFSFASSGCSLGVDAQIDFGTSDPVGLLGAKVVADIGTVKSYPLQYDPVNGRWRSNAEIPIDSQAGPVT